MGTSNDNGNERMAKLSEKLSKVSNVIENEKVNKYEQYENKVMSLYSSIEETKDLNNKKFNDVKEQILVIQKTLDEESSKREEKIFEKFDYELNCKKEIEIKISGHLEDKFNIIKSDLQKESKTRYDSIENLEYYFEKELPKIQEAFKV